MLEVLIIDLVSQENQHSSLKSSASELTLSLGEDDFYRIEHVLQIQEHKLLNRLDFRESFSDDGDDDFRLLFLGENALFFLFLRSRSSSFFSFEDVNDNSERNHAHCFKHERLTSNVTISKSNDSLVDKSSDVLDTIKSDTIESKAISVTITKSRITLQLRSSKEIASKLKILLRLIQSRANKIRYSKSSVNRKRELKT